MTADALGVTIRVGDSVLITSYGYAARLIDTGRTVKVTGFTSAGNVAHNGGSNGADPVANGRAIRPACVAVLRRDGRKGLEGNRI